MNDEARKGRQIVLIIIAGLLLPNLALALLSGNSIKVSGLRLVISFLISFLLWRGYSWARSYMAFSLGLAALLTALSGLLAVLVLSWMAVVLLLAPLYAWGAWALWSSPTVEAYIEYCERQRNPDMSFNTGA